MSKTKIENTREHDIIVAVALPSGEITQVSVPAAKEQDKEDGTGTTMVPGVAEIEDEVLELAKEKEVIQHYFNDGWLRIKKSGGATKTAKAAEAPAAPVGGAKAPWNTDKS